MSDAQRQHVEARAQAKGSFRLKEESPLVVSAQADSRELVGAENDCSGLTSLQGSDFRLGPS